MDLAAPVEVIFQSSNCHCYAWISEYRATFSEFLNPKHAASADPSAEAVD